VVGESGGCRHGVVARLNPSRNKTITLSEILAFEKLELRDKNMPSAAFSFRAAANLRRRSGAQKIKSFQRGRTTAGA
jgi:hypothetical protein